LAASPLSYSKPEVAACAPFADFELLIACNHPKFSENLTQGRQRSFAQLSGGNTDGAVSIVESHTK